MLNLKWWDLVRLEDLLEDKKNLSYGIVQPWIQTDWWVNVLRPVDIKDNILYLEDQYLEYDNSFSLPHISHLDFILILELNDKSSIFKLNVLFNSTSNPLFL